MTITRTRCPCCGSALSSYPAENAAALVSPTMGEIVRRLRRSPGEFVSVEDLALYVWGRDPMGGPDNPKTNISNVIAYNRNKLRALGWDIVGRIGPSGGYMLRADQ